MADYSANIALKVDQSGLNQVRDLEERLKAIRKSIKAIGQGGIGGARSDGNTRRQRSGGGAAEFAYEGRFAKLQRMEQKRWQRQSSEEIALSKKKNEVTKVNIDQEVQAGRTRRRASDVFRDQLNDLGQSMGKVTREIDSQLKRREADLNRRRRDIDANRGLSTDRIQLIPIDDNGKVLPAATSSKSGNRSRKGNRSVEEARMIFNDFMVLEQADERVRKNTSDRTKKQLWSMFDAWETEMAGTAAPIRPTKFDGGARESVDAKLKAELKRASVMRQINELETKGVNVTRLRKAMGEATTAQSKRQYGLASKLQISLDNQVKNEQSKLRILEHQNRTLKEQDSAIRKNATSSPVRGGRDFPGSPLWHQEQIRNATSSPVSGGIAFPQSPKALKEVAKVEKVKLDASIKAINVAAKAEEAAARKGLKNHQMIEQRKEQIELKRIRDTAARELKTDLKMAKAVNDFYIKDFDRVLKARERIKGYTHHGNQYDRPIGPEMASNFDRHFALTGRAGKTNYPSSPILGNEGTRGSPLAKKAMSKRMESLMLGVGFPMMFGAGTGSIAGSLAGSFAGPGFGGQILGGAIGQVIDDFVKSITTFAAALDKPTAALQAMGTVGIQASDKLKKNIASLEKAGRVYDAQKLIFEEIGTQIGPDAVDQLAGIAEANKEITKASGELHAQLVGSMLPAILAVAKAMALLGSKDGATSDEYKTAVSMGMNFAGNLLFPVQTKVAQGLDLLGRGQTDPTAATDAQGKAKAEQAKNLAKLAELHKTKLDLLKNENALMGKNDDLLDKAVVKKKEEAIALQHNLAIQKAGDNIDEKALAIQIKRNKEKQLGLDIATAELKAKEDAARLERERQRAAAKAASDLRNQVKATDRAAIGVINDDIESRRLGISEAAFKGGPKAGIEKESKELLMIFNLEKQILNHKVGIALADAKSAEEAKFIRESAQIQVDILARKAELRQKELERQYKQIGLEERMTLEITKQNNALASRQGDRRMQSMTLQLQDPFNSSDTQNKQMDLEHAAELDAQRVNYSQQILELETKITAMGTQDTSNENKRLALLRAESAEAEKRLVQENQMEKALLRQNQILEQYGFIIDRVSQGFADAIIGVVKGTETVEQAFGRMLEDIGQQLIRQATALMVNKVVMMLLNALTSGMGPGVDTPGTGGDSFAGVPNKILDSVIGKAAGGPVTGGRPYLIGEQGPELFMPGVSGNIVPNHLLSTYSPGNNSSAGGTGPINVSYNGPQLNFNGDEYVPKSAVPELIATAARQGAKQGQAMTMSGLRNSRSQRSRVGL